MKKLLIVFFFLGFITYTFAGTTGKLAGFIKDKKTGEPLPGVNVMIKGTTMGAATDADGQYYIVNIPVGTYTVEVSMIGYQKLVINNVAISADITTKLDLQLAETSLELENIEITAEAPPVQKDLTATTNVITSQQVQTLPVTDLRQVVGLQTGIVIVPIRLEQAGQFGNYNTTPDDGLHFRGGRSNETSYLLNGISLKDPIWGGFNIEDLPMSGLNQLVTYTGTYLAEFGEGMSAVMNMVSEPIHQKTKFAYTTYTDDLGSLNIEQLHTYNHELTLKGAVPGFDNKVHINIAGRYLTTDGRFNGYIYPNYRDTEGHDKSGDPKVVPMNYNDLYSALGSMDYNITNNIRLIVGGLYVNQNTSIYNHFFKYNPYGAPRIKKDYWLGYAQLKHVLSQKYFYDISASRYVKHFKSSVFDDLESGLIEEHLLSPDLFSVSGIDYVWFNSGSTSDQFTFNFLGQVTPIHQLKTGISYTQHDLNYEFRNPTAPDADTTQKRMKAWESYNRKPYVLNAYLQDKMEFHKIGMILNIGLRYDLISPKTYMMQDKLRPTTSKMIMTDAKQYISPRLGVSFPIANKMAVRFAYGIYYQFPHFFLTYQGANEEDPIYPNYGLSEVTTIGDGDINPERTTSYEVGLQVGINPQTSLNITTFYRDISDLVGLRTIHGPRTYQLFTNDAYAIAKGVEIAFNSKISKNLSMFVNYTFSEVSASKQSTWYVPLFPQNRTFIADWDIPHKLSFNIEYLHPSQFGVSIIGNLNSGFPYSPNSLNPNSERGPSQNNVDINLYKKFKLFGFSETFFIHITNIFNKKNVWWVYSDTGQPGVDANEATSDDYTRDPTAWGPPRHIRIGLKINY
jgi:hypothetical protein